MMVCANCGGTMVGDGVTEVMRCENADEALYAHLEPDANPVDCSDAGDDNPLFGDVIEHNPEDDSVCLCCNGTGKIPGRFEDDEPTACMTCNGGAGTRRKREPINPTKVFLDRMEKLITNLLVNNKNYEGDYYWDDMALRMNYRKLLDDTKERAGHIIEEMHKMAHLVELTDEELKKLED